ncbi:MAG: hypothetical protein L3V56_02650 [Candidatus Magnetoovum sp. WYHC-5]|nr:hypothetical protein [Candidatus Magnetoovum sp. WYHC-5]
MRKLTYFFSLLFVTLVTFIIIYFNITKPRIMIIHSYHPEYAWTRDINIGLIRVLERHPNYSIKWHYMDTQRHSGKEWFRKAGIMAREAVDQWEPHVLILLDDSASELVGKYYVNHPKINIVFAGLNGDYKPYGYHTANNVTGILEQKQLQALKETIQMVEIVKTFKAHTTDSASNAVNLSDISNIKMEDKHNVPRIFYLSDPSESLKIFRIFMDTFDWKPFNYIGSYEANDYEDWKKAVLENADKTDYIIVANYRKLPKTSKKEDENKFASAKEVMEWTEKNSKMPVIGINVFNVEDGAMLSVGVSPYEQGEVSAQMAVDIIEGIKQPKDIPIKLNEQFIIALRKSIMQGRGIELPAIYEAFARATANYYE